MFRIFIRNENGEEEHHLSEGNYIKFIIEEAKIINDIEIYLVDFGKLGDELFRDKRLKDKLELEDKDRINRIVMGKCFPDLGICFVSCVSNLSLFTKNLLHELFHFKDPYKHIKSDAVYNTNDMIRDYIINHLNDFYAENNAMKVIIELYKHRQRGINLMFLYSFETRYLEGNEKNVKEQFVEMKKKEIPNFDTQSKFIYSIQHHLIKPVMYFLAIYRAYVDSGFKHRLCKLLWQQFLEELNPIIKPYILRIERTIMNPSLNLNSQSEDIFNDILENIMEFYNTEYQKYYYTMNPSLSPLY